ncbi:DUF308 domain-containing protein [Niabella beijingensis]|uniref:DUF308 domain-containing protein n=1 Tax=Niabella beijingensis TaxID=2872700 RepID=UPI001CBE00AD|nr:DUF308 domain-containing protein [Niabella beijingensis]MBZ4191627.1 DUF308 domain-containing protein [Niabella beijingensis]
MQPVTIKPRTNRLPLWPITPIASILLIGISVYIFTYPWDSYLQLIKLSGIGILLNGLLLIVLYYIEGALLTRSIWLLMESVLNSLFGALMLFNPLLNFLLFSYFTSIWAICWGCLKIVQSLFQKKELRGWYLLSAEGACAIVIGGILLHLPFIKARQTIQWICLLLFLIGFLNIFINLKNKTFKKNLPIIL